MELQLRKVAERLETKNITIKPTTRVYKHLTETGYDEIYGARPLKRLIQSEILDELSLQIIEGKIGEGDVVEVDYDAKKGSVVVESQMGRKTGEVS